jgi:hypothetical protein
MSRMCLLYLAFAFGLVAITPAPAHDSWISRGGLKNAAGEWCCGEGDCFSFTAKEVQASPVGFKLINGEVIPYSEAQPSPDGLYWRCKRPDGTRRCFFAPPGAS